VPGREREVVAALCEPVRDSTAEAGAGSDDQQVAWIDGGAIAQRSWNTADFNRWLSDSLAAALLPT
jgi:hypothetical protein